MTEPVPPNVTEDQLKLLLDQQTETEVLDYKSELDLVDKSKKSRARSSCQGRRGAAFRAPWAPRNRCRSHRPWRVHPHGSVCARGYDYSMTKAELIEQVKAMTEEEAAEVKLIYAPDWPSKATSIEEIRKQTGTTPMSREDFDRHFGSLPTDGEG